MPCMTSDGMGDAYREDPQARDRIAKLEAMLCALVKVAGIDRALESADWKEAGVGADELRKWWEDHKAKDHERAVREAVERAKKNFTDLVALGSPEQMEALLTMLEVLARVAPKNPERFPIVETAIATFRKALRVDSPFSSVATGDSQ